MSLEKILKDNKLFWQYPVCTEKQFYLQNREDTNYLGFPWATAIDSNISLLTLVKLIAPLVDKDKKYYTCCQHIFFHRLARLFDIFNIKDIYTPHKKIGEEVLGLDTKGVTWYSSDTTRLHPCPLYAVNVEDPTRNSVFENQDFMQTERSLLFSFIGCYREDYLSDVRGRILNLKDDDAAIYSLENWHFDEIVYRDNNQNYKHDYEVSQIHNKRTELYNKTLLDSKYSLCPSGTGPNSIRFWESLAVGAIPILLADTLELPKHDLWEKAILRVREEDVETIPELLRSIGKEEEEDRRSKCLDLYSFYRSDYKNDKN